MGATQKAKRALNVGTHTQPPLKVYTYKIRDYCVCVCCRRGEGRLPATILNDLNLDLFKCFIMAADSRAKMYKKEYEEKRDSRSNIFLLKDVPQQRPIWPCCKVSVFRDHILALMLSLTLAETLNVVHILGMRLRIYKLHGRLCEHVLSRYLHLIFFFFFSVGVIIILSQSNDLIPRIHISLFFSP